MPLSSWIKNKWTGHRTVRVALMGSKSSGKTVFLTAIANHLANHNPESLNLDGLDISCSSNAIPGEMVDGLPRFNYLEAINSFERGEWPSKTVEPTVLAMELTIRDKSTGRDENVRFEMLDIPGERVSDFAMFGRTYEEWCRWMEYGLGGPNGTSYAYRQYLDKAKQCAPNDGDQTKQFLFDTYREFIVDGYKNYAPHVTPSTLKLELDGTKHGGTPDEFRESIRSLPIGFRDEKGKTWEFVPLPSSFLVKNSPWRHIVDEFRKSYKQYTKKVVRPMERWLESSARLFYLVDVLSLLQAGPRAWASERNNGVASVEALYPVNKSFFGGLGRSIMSLLTTRIRHLCIVATKADLVLSEDRDNLCTLAGILMKNVLPNRDSKVVSCAAVCSTNEVRANINGSSTPALQGKLASDKMAAPETWIPSPVPSSLPGTTQAWKDMEDRGQFNYQPTFPFFDPSMGLPPEHLGLNTLVKDMLSK